MEQTGRILKKAQVETARCVACGCCVKVGPKNAIHVVSGVCAQVDQARCVGCGRCGQACPAGIITIQEVRP